MIAISINIAVLLIELLLVRLRPGTYVLGLDVWFPPHPACSVEIRDQSSSGFFRLNEAAPGQGAVTPMHT